MLKKVKMNEKVINKNVYPFTIPVIGNFKSLDINKNVTFIVGDNGSGKSTLLEAMAVCAGCNPEGGSKNLFFQTNETHSNLYDYLTLVYDWKKQSDVYFLRAESFYNVATELENIHGFDGMEDIYGKSLHAMSHGESFLSLIENRFNRDGLFFLDEPEAALSAMGQLSLLAYLNEFSKGDAQFIIATHSPLLVAFPHSDIYEIQDGNLMKKEYSDLEFVSIYKSFVNNPKGFINRLSRDEI